MSTLPTDGPPPQLLEGEKPVEPAAPPRYIVEAHSSFELFGSTVTFREHQVISEPREVKIAQEHNVPLLQLVPSG